MMKACDNDVLVTGGTGFLGRTIVERLLAQGRSVRVLSRRGNAELAAMGCRMIQASLSDASAVKEACRGVESVFHVAAKVGIWGEYKAFYECNVLGTRYLIEGCKIHGVKRLIYTSTPSVVYNGRDIAEGDERMPLTGDCPASYPLTKAIAEAEVLSSNSESLKTIALRPHLIWGRGDPHLIPRVLERAKKGKLLIVGEGKNRVDMIHVSNAADAHLLAEVALQKEGCQAAGKAYFITNDEPVELWPWINTLLTRMGISPIRKKLSLKKARFIGMLCEGVWRSLRLNGEPPMTRFVADELAKDHWFSMEAAKRDLAYTPSISMQEGMQDLIAALNGR